MFNFYVAFAGHDRANEAGRTTTCRVNVKAPSLYTKSKKHQGHSENMGFDWRRNWRFQTRKKTETLFSTFQKTPVGHQDPEAIKWISPLQTVRLKKQNLKEGFHIKTVGSLQD